MSSVDVRLDAYIEQIGPPITYDKAPVWKAELGLTGPRAIASQERRGRPMTRHEKIVKLLQHLEESDLINTKREFGWRARSPHKRNDFVYEICTASKVLIPPKPDTESTGLVLWISPVPPVPTSENESPGDGSGLYGGRPGMLCLLEDFRKSDNAPYSGYYESAYTILESIILAVGEDLRKLVISDLFPRAEIRRGQDARLEAWDRATPHMAEFIKDPVATLERVGCRAAKSRNIRVLYRIREFAPEAGERDHRGRFSSTSVFDYPIFIAAER